jgi:hypothetical protein
MEIFVGRQGFDDALRFAPASLNVFHRKRHLAIRKIIPTIGRIDEVKLNFSRRATDSDVKAR